MDVAHQVRCPLVVDDDVVAVVAADFHDTLDELDLARGGGAEP